MDLTFSTAAILSFVPATSLIVNVRFNHNENIKDTKRHQRATLQQYAVDLIGTLWKFSDLQVRYLNERLIIQRKIENDEELDSTHSHFVYQMKDELLHLKTELRRKVWNSQIEISRHDFPKLRNSVAKIFLAINVFCKPYEGDFDEPLDELKIKILERNLSHEIKDLTKDFGRQSDQLTLEIKNANLYHDLKRLFHNLHHWATGGRNKRKPDESAKKVFGESSGIEPITEYLTKVKEETEDIEKNNERR